MRRFTRKVRAILDRTVRITMSVAMLTLYLNIQVIPPTPALANPASLSVSASVSSRPLLGGKATVHMTVKNTDTTDKAYNVSLKDVLSSSRAGTQGVATFVSATDGDGPIVPTSVTTTVSTGDATVSFVNIRDLAPQETYNMDLVVDISGDSSWAAGDLLQNAVTAYGNTIPNQTIPDISAATSASAPVLPIVIRAKTVHQSTGVEQATGTGARAFYYTIDVQNNYTAAIQSVVVTDTIPDGIEYLGPHGASPAPDSVSRDASTGVTTLVWDLGTMPASAPKQLAYDAGIRYDYYGTNNGGVSRPDTSTLTTASAGQPIITTASSKKVFTNHAALSSSWKSNPATDSATADVTGAALTIAKGSDKTSGGLGTVINYTLTYATSEYYSAIASGDLTLVHDHLPDGQVFTTSTANPAPLSVLHNPDGSTDITWTVGAVANTSGGAITFSAEVGTKWEQPSYAGDPIVSGDSMVNSCDISGVASDSVNPSATPIPTTSSASVGFSTHLPSINKRMLDPTSGTWSQNVTMTVGTTSTVRVRFNTTDGATAEHSDINMGNIDLTDWLPAGMSVVPGTFHATYSGASDFTLPTTGTPPPLNISDPTTTSIGGVNGVSWYLGNVAPAGWWQATFDVQIDDIPAVRDGIIVANLFKLTGVNTFGTPYSARDMAMVDYATPHLTLTKAVTPPSPLTGGTQVPYTLAIDNTSQGPAEQVSIVDTLPVGERLTAPTIDSVTLDGTTLTAGSGYVTSWNGASGALSVTLQQGAVRTPMPGGSHLVVAYTATTDSGVVANSSLTNTASVGYSSRSTSDGRVTPVTNNPADVNTDIATIHPQGLTIAKSGPAGPFTIGDTFGYDVTVTVPAHEIAYWPSIADKISHEGLVATGTPTITTVGGSPDTPASFASTSTTPVRSAPSSGTTLLTFDLNDPIDNSSSSQPYQFRIDFNVQYTGLKAGNVWEFTLPNTTDSFNDSATVSWNSVASAIRQTNSSADSTSVTTALVQPRLATVKSITSTGTYAGGSIIDYRLVITNTGTSRAFDPSIVDTLPTASANASLTAATLTGVGDLLSGGHVTSFVATPTMRAGFDSAVSIGTTQTLTLNYRVTLTTNVGSGVALANAADVNWDSLAGAPGGSRVYNDSGQENWSQDTAAMSTNAAKATISKRGPAGPIRIGDVVTYSIDATVPANTIAWYPVFTDTLNQRGISYVSNSATITTRASAPAVPADLGGSSTPTVTTGTSSKTLTWNLPASIDNAGNSQSYAFTLTFQVQVTGDNAGAWDYWPATNAQSIADTSTLAWRDIATGGPATNQAANSGSVVTSVTQPVIKTTKTILTPGPLAGGSTVDYQVVLSNTASNTAYDISVTDTFPAEFGSATLATATETGVGSILSSATTDFSHLPTSSVTFDSDVSMGTTQTITLVYHGVLASTVGAGVTLTNNADANWSSLPGVVAGERTYNDATTEASWSQDTTSVATATPVATFSKSVTSATTGTIGSAVVYSLNTTVPANETAYSLLVTDTVPNCLTVIAANASLPGTLTVGVPGASGTLVTYDGGDTAGSSTPTTFTVTLFCQVRDTRWGGGAVPSGTFSNSALLAWRTRASGGTTLTASGAATFTVMQPALAITKSVTPTTAGPGDSVTYTSVITNTGNAPAYDFRWTDTANASMTAPTLVAVKPSGLATLVAGTDFSSVSAGTSLTVLFDQPSSPRIEAGQTVTITWTASAIAGIHNGAAMADTATANSYTSLPSTSVARTYASVSATRAVTGLSPALVTSKSVVGSAYPLPGDTVHFRFTVRNVGTAPALAVVATDTLPADLTYAGSSVATWPSGSSNANPSGGSGPTLVWSQGATLGAGETLAVTFDALVSSSAPTRTVVNTVTAGATDALGAPVPANCNSWVPSDGDPTDHATANVRIVQPGVAVAKVLPTGGDQFVQVGQRTGFRLTVTNTGDTTLTTVPLTDTYDPSVLSTYSASITPSSTTPPNVRWSSFGTIAPFASKSVNVTFTVLAQPASGVATNYASVTSVVDEFGHTLGSTQDTATVNVTHPAVVVTKTRHAGQDATIQAGDPAVFDITVTNAGDTTLTTVPLADTFASANLTFTSASVTPSSTASGSASWSNLGTLVPGASTSLTVSFVASSAPVGHTSIDTATVASALDVHSDSPATASATSSVAITRPHVTVTKTRVSAPVIQAGESVIYRLGVTNSGDTTLSTIALGDTWDGAALGSVSATPAESFEASGVATWTLFGPLAPGASTVVTLTLSALSVPSGQVTIDTATVSGTDEFTDHAPGNDSSASVRITSPSVSVAKVLHAGQDPQIQVGMPVAYDITIRNTGDTTLSTVPLTDTYDGAALTYSMASIVASSAVGGVATWNSTGALAPGASRTIVATFTAASVPAGQVSNDTAKVSGAIDQYGDTPPDATASASIRITHPNIAVVKTRATSQDGQIQAGQTAAFDLAVTNTGDTTLNTVSLTDTWDQTVFDYVSATVAPSSSASGTATWALGTLAPSATTTVTLTLHALTSPASVTTTDTASVAGADIYGDAAGPSASSATVLVTNPAVAVLKTLATGQDPQIQAGDTVRFDLRVTNSGNTPLATVPLSDTFDSAVLAYTTATVAPTSAGSGALSWSDTGSLAVGATRIVTVTFTALAVPSGQVTVDSLACTGSVDVHTDPVPDASSTGSVRITHPAVAITKMLHAGQDAAVQSGHSVAFDITVTNTGDTTLTTVPLTDTYDSTRLVFTGASPSSANTISAGTAHWNNLGTLAPGASTSVTASFSAIWSAAGQVTTNTGTVPLATDQYGDHPADATATASVKITHPALTLSKTLTSPDPYIQTGETVTFHLAVTNTGDTTLTSVPMADTWESAHLQFVSASVPAATPVAGLAQWTLGPIAPGATSGVDLTLRALGQVPSYVTTDTATVTGAIDENSDPANDDASFSSIQITTPSIAITKALHAGQDTAIQVGGTVTYDIGVTNIGDIGLNTVPLTDVFDPAVFRPTSATPAIDSTGTGSASWNDIGSLTAGQTTTVTVTFTAVGTSGGHASIDTATVAGAIDVHGDGTATESATAAELVTRPHVALTKALAEGQPTTVRLGSTVTYNLTATNDGDTTLSVVPLVDTFAASQFVFVSAAAPPDVVASGSLTWGNVAASVLAPGASVTTQVRMRTLVAGSELLNTADVAFATDTHGDTTPRADAHDSALSVYDVASLDVTKTAEPAAGTILLPSQTITYTIAWNNTGGVSMPGVVLTDPLPGSVIYVPGTLKSGNTMLTDAVDADAGQYSATSHTVSVNLGDVGAESRGAVTFQVTVAPENLSAKGVQNTAFFASQESTAATTGPVYHPVDPITITKVGKDLNGGTLRGGDVIEWSITVQNTGLTPTTHVVVNDTVPDTTTYVKGSIRGLGANDSGLPNLVWDIGTLAVGESQVVTFRSAVKKGLPGGTLVRNQASVTSDQNRRKLSDNPQTSTNGDPTILTARTSGSEDWRMPLGALLLTMVAGLWLWPRRRQLAVQPLRREDQNSKGGDRNA